LFVVQHLGPEVWPVPCVQTVAECLESYDLFRGRAGAVPGSMNKTSWDQEVKKYPWTVTLAGHVCRNVGLQ
jgi:hypothetical protein